MVESVPMSPRELIRHLPDLLAGEEPGLNNPRVTDFLVEHPTARIAVSAASCLSHALREGVSSRGLDRPTRLSMETLAGPLKREMALLSFRAGVAELEVYAHEHDLAYRGFAEQATLGEAASDPETLLELFDLAGEEATSRFLPDPRKPASLETTRDLLNHARKRMRTPALDWYVTHVQATLSPAEAVPMWEELSRSTPVGSTRAMALNELAWSLRENGNSTRAMQVQTEATTHGPRQDCMWFNAMFYQALSGNAREAIHSAQELMSNLVPSPGVIEQYAAFLASNAQELRTAMMASSRLRADLPSAVGGMLQSTLLEITR